MIDPQLPFIDLHRHLEGCLRLETILDLGRRFNLPLPAWTVDELRPHVQIQERQPGVMAFIAKFQWPVGVLGDYEACRRVAYEVVEDLRREDLDYAEIRFSPLFMAEPHGLDPVGVVEAVCDGVAAAVRDCGIPVGLTGILSRTYGPEAAWRELEALMTGRDHIVALDLAGDEANYPGFQFVEHFRQAREAGWQVTVHAGEADGAQSIWQALLDLGAQRIGHAVHAVDDPALMDYLSANRIGVEMNLTSNVQTSTVPDYAFHPALQFLDHGILASLNSDDPAISGIDLRYEYQVAAPRAGLSAAQVRQAQLNALESAFLSPANRERLLERKRRPDEPAP